MIFEDPSEQRWKIARIIFWLAAALGLFGLADLGTGLLTNPALRSPEKLTARHGPPVKAIIEQETDSDALPDIKMARPPGVPRRATERWATLEFIRSAFLVQGDPPSVNDFKANRDKLDVIFPDWYRIDQHQVVESIFPTAKELIQQGDLLVLPRVSNTDSTGVWKGEEFAFLMADGPKARALITVLADKIQAIGADGVNLDIEDLSPKEHDDYTEWLQFVVAEFHRRGLLVTVDLPINDAAFDYEAIGAIVDGVIAMAYDQSFPGGKPGPLAGQNWFLDGIEDLKQRIPPRKLLIGIGAYGYDWDTTGQTEARALTFEEAMFLAEETSAEIETDKDSINSTFRYQDSDKHEHSVWFLDAISAWNQSLAVRENGLRGLSLWRLGMEEPRIWDFFGSSVDAFAPEELGTIKPLKTVIMENEGEFLTIREIPEDGKRTLSTDGRKVEYAAYESLPHYFLVERFGATAQKLLALTFDDGPDPTWTPLILDVLKQFGVKGTFFVVGDQVQRYPDLLSAEFEAGHLIGNHTFLHPNLSEISSPRLRMELNTTQRTIESIIRHSTLLFRAPFNTDSSPTEPEELAPLHYATRHGYLIAAGDIDSADYSTPGVNAIVNRVLKGVEASPASHVIVMHDAGGNRQQTVDALRKLIPALQAKGYSFVPASDLLGMSQDALMPALSTFEQVVIVGNAFINWSLTTGWKILMWLFFCTTAIAILRIVFLGTFVLKTPRRKPVGAAGFCPALTVLVPAYNEAKVIAGTIDAVLRSDYPAFSVLVVDDGSTDGTGGIVKRYAAQDPRVQLVEKPNGGKYTALNLGFEKAETEYIVTIDADTIILPNTLRELVQPFSDVSVDAVCGNVQVGNVRNILTAFQDVEYVTTQNYDRRAFDSLNCISVVPGATGAWKRASVLRLGGYSGDTLTEDADLTLSVLAAGGRIAYAPEARSITEAPEAAKALFKQRFRWSFGTYQCLWKHREQFGNGSLGWIALPNMLLFQILFPVLAPIGDVVWIMALLRGDARPVVAGYLLFLAMDLAGTLIAFALENRSFWRAWVVLIQRFYYRQFMYVVTFKALLSVLKGKRQHWNKLDRLSSIRHHHEAKSQSATPANPA